MKDSSAAVKKILVVEDEPRIRQICRRTLTSQEYRVDFATNGATAKDMLAEEDYDLLLIDIRTPVMNGKQLYQTSEDRYPRLINRVVFTTGDVVSNGGEHYNGRFHKSNTQGN